jgi:hypothetical protein
MRKLLTLAAVLYLGKKLFDALLPDRRHSPARLEDHTPLFNPVVPVELESQLRAVAVRAD